MTTLMQGLIQLLEHPLVHSLGWTLLHFCWQGAAVALMLGCVLGLLGGRSSQARYAAACLALGLMVVLPAATFAHIASAEYKARTAILGPGIVLDSSIVLDVGADEPIPPWPARIGMALDRSLPWVLLAWFAGVIVFIGRLNVGLLVARRLKTAGTEAPPPALLHIFNQLRIRLGVHRVVQLLHSAQVQVPMVIGWLRPVVLLPVTCLTGLSPEQIEAVLCHELAHVRRHDYLVSVIQSVIETILFYHPAVWWVSRQVRRERECCCDELAVAVGGDVLAYARALSFLEESRASFPEFVLGANGGILKMRIQRILGSRRDTEGSPAAALLTLGLLLAVAGSYFAAVSHAQAQARAQSQTQPQVRTQSPPTEIAAAAAPAGVVSVSQEGTASPGTAAAQPLHGAYKTWLEQDVRWIVTDSEAQAFRQLANDDERDKFTDQFWARRDPPGAAPGTYRQEHYARIAYSNEHFAAGKPGWMTDRGHIYIVYGKPESIDSHPTSGGTVSAFPYEVWHYKYITGIGDNVDLTFVDTCQCGDYHYTIDPSEKAARAALPGIGLAKQESAQLDAIDSQISLAKKILAPPAISDKEQDAAPRATAAQEAGSISGKIVDPTGALVPHAKVTATNTDDGVRTSRVTDNSGTYSISPLEPGPYNVEVQAKGFQRMLQENIHVVAGQTVGLNLKLTVGGATQSLTVTGKSQIAAPPPPPPLPAMSGNPIVLPQRISSGVMQGLAISQPQPVYPPEAKAQRIQGTVILHARISKDGTVKDVQVLSGPPPLLVSAIDAVRQWKYKPYLVDGEPTEVDTTININFTLDGDKPQPDPDNAPSGTPQVSSSDRSRSAIFARLIETITIAASDPQYPPIAKAAHVQGDVLLRVAVSRTGEAEDVKLISGLPMLVSSAMEAARKWKFNQASFLSNEGTPIDAVLIVKFTLNDAARPQGERSPNDAPIADVLAPAQTAPQQYDGVPVRRIGGGVTQPEVIYKVDPEFSAEAKKAKFNGIVLVNLIVDAKGMPQNVHVLRGVGMGLDEQAMAAVKKYKFRPATEGGKPVPVAMNVEVNFKIF